MKYTLPQYVHDGFRLRQIDEERDEIRRTARANDWVKARYEELQEEEALILKRMRRYELHPNNRP